MKPLYAILGLLCGQAFGLVHREYKQSDHELFAIGAPKPTANHSCPYQVSRFTGIGWIENDKRKMLSLISPEHVLFSKHFAPLVGQKVQFLNREGEVKTYTLSAIETVQAEAPNSSDLIVGQLDRSVQSEDGIEILSYYNPKSSLSLNGKNLIVVAQGGRIGSSAISNICPLNIQQIGTIQALMFNFYGSGRPSDCYLDFGDSGGPSFIEEQGKIALIGIHCAVVQDAERTFVQSIDSYVPAYESGINSILARSAYRLRPHSAVGTQLTASITPLKNALESRSTIAELQISNSGTIEAGNLEIKLVFESGKTPAQINGDAWQIRQISENVFCVRRNALAGSSSTKLQLMWDSCDSFEQLQLDLMVESDSSRPMLTAMNIGRWLTAPIAAAVEVAAPLINLARSVNNDPARLDDDHDGVPNLAETLFTHTDPSSPSFGTEPSGNTIVKFAQAKGSYFGSVFDRDGKPKMSAVLILTATGVFNLKTKQIDRDLNIRGTLDNQGCYDDELLNCAPLIHASISLEAIEANHYALRGKFLTQAGDIYYFELLGAAYSKVLPCRLAGKLALDLADDAATDRGKNRFQASATISKLGQCAWLCLFPNGSRATYANVMIERDLIPLQLRAVQGKTKTTTELLGTISVSAEAKNPAAQGRLLLCQLSQKPKLPAEKLEQLCSIN